ncbi:alpha/beta hydrolase fold-domain-containing protein [Cunninghamella echinulata]|nr:alpha/beta hydrolase fold-domain-containing protein [Cunninghamella echinulata]
MAISKKSPAHPTYDAVFKLLSAGPKWHELEPVDLRALVDNSPLPPGVVIPETLVDEKEIVIGLQETEGQQVSSNIKLIISRPLDTEKQILPAFIYLHGGGFVTGTFESSKKFVKDLTVRAGVAVIFVSYTLSPEVRFPVAPEECYSSILWIHQHANELNIDPSKLVVGGESAGGNLSAVSSILLKKRGHSDVLKGQVLLYPIISSTGEGYESRGLYGDGDYVLSTKDMEYFKKKYFGNNYEISVEDIRFSPIIATDEELNGLPRALVITAECDILRDEGEAYSRRLLKAGVKTIAIRSLGAMHGFTMIPLDTENYIHAIQSIANFIHSSI